MLYINDILAITENSKSILNQINDFFLSKKRSVASPKTYLVIDTRLKNDSQGNDEF